LFGNNEPEKCFDPSQQTVFLLLLYIIIEFFMPALSGPDNIAANMIRYCRHLVVVLLWEGELHSRGPFRSREEQS
jgi:hypothetical protein